MKTSQYRFTNGSLYEFSKESNAYIHVYKNAFVTTKKAAIEAYENSYLEY